MLSIMCHLFTYCRLFVVLNFYMSELILKNIKNRLHNEFEAQYFIHKIDFMLSFVGQLFLRDHLRKRTTY